MPLSTDSVGVAVRDDERAVPNCWHDFIRIEKWEETLISEDRATDDFGLTGPIRRRRMTTTYEKYRCRRCGEEDIRSDTCWEMLAP
ncbi:MAG TPA: hypothetical protein VHE61_20440 [Opitutaceae bacterium]|nr:hypothetical protein [Opitutaceae bacterium]